jgi:hypothetical protein
MYVCFVMWIVCLVVGITWLGDRNICLLLALMEGHTFVSLVRGYVVVVTGEEILCSR